MKSTPALLDDVLFINGYATPLNQPESLVKIPTFKEALLKYDKDSNNLLTREELPNEPVYSWFEFVDVAGDGSMDAEDWNYFQAALASLNGMLAIRLGGNGDMTERNTLWQYHRSIPQLPSPLVYMNVLYMVNDGGIVTSFRPESGEVIQEGRLKGGGSQYYASPVAADGKVIIISRKGKVSVLNPDGNLEVMASTDLNEECYATPAIAQGQIYIRTVNTLYCFGSVDY
jgi:hypothetical protein